jgi:peptide/nickel transport system ATP-binding protein
MISEERTLASERNPLLRLDGLSLRLGASKLDLVQSASLEVGAGETLCIVGESGCGKSITALSLMGLLPRDVLQVSGGTMTFEGDRYDLATFDRFDRLRGDRMAMIFQEPMTSLNPSFRIGEQVAEAVRCHRDCTRPEALSLALSMLRRVGIADAEKRLHEYPHQLSGGMRQRVMIAMALINNPSLLIADEPTTALDVTIQAQILDLIRDLQNDTGMATIMITHDLGVVAVIATSVAVMYAGQIVETGSAYEIFENPQHPYTIGLMSSVPRLSGPRQRLATIPGTVPTVTAMPQGCRFSTRCPFAQPVCAEVPALVPVQGADQSDHRVACFFAPLETRLEIVA